MFRLQAKARPALVLTGPRSVGKTTVAKLLAERLGMPWYDTDVLVNDGLSARFDEALAPPQQPDAPLPHLVAAMKQGRFDWIATVLQESCKALAASRSNHVLAAAGGAFAYPEVVGALHEGGLVVGLVPSMDATESAKVLFGRERQRPHFRGVPDAELLDRCRDHVAQVLELLDKEADNVLCVGDDGPDAVADSLIGTLLNR